MMEWNAKSPLQWDWENLFMFNSKAVEYPKKSRPSDWVIDGEGSIDFGSFYGSAGGRVGSGSCSDVGHVSSKSSKSASINSSSIGEMKTSNFIHEAFDDIPEDFSNKKDFTKPHMTDASPTFDTSVCSGEPLLGLELGRQTYFEDVCAGSSSKTSSLSVIPMSSETPTKKSKTNCLSTHNQRCQVEGCNLDLSSAKDYHRKHRVCETHSKCSKVIVNGQERRFCQQCSRFHGLSEFDEKKRSCRRRLSDHNARRRKPQPEAVRLSQGMLSSSLNDMRQQMNLVLNRAPMVQARAATTLSWESTCLPTFTQAKGYQFKPAKAGVMDGQMINFSSNELSVTSGSHDHPNRLLPSKATTAEVLKGFEESGMSSSNMEGTQDLHRALSLLSTDSWSPKASLPTTMHGRGLECWYAVQESTKSDMHVLTSPTDHSTTNHFQEFQLLKSPFEGGFYPQ